MSTVLTNAQWCGAIWQAHWRQYLYFCTIKASKMNTEEYRLAHPRDCVLETSSLRSHTLVASGLIHKQIKASHTGDLRPHTLVA